METKLKEFLLKKLPTTKQEDLKYIILAQLWDQSRKIEEEIEQNENADGKT